jgi:ABC-type multidrug transport system fused ATPase/permease subunit
LPVKTDRSKSSASCNEISWLVHQGRPHIRSHFGSLCCIFISSLIALVDPIVMKWLIDGILPRRDMKLLPLAASAFFFSYIGRLVFSSLSGLITFQVAQKTVFRIKLRLLRRLQTLPSEYHDKTPVGDSLRRMEQDVDEIGQLGGDFIPLCLRLFVTTAMILTAMFVMNWQLTCIVLPLIPAFLYAQHCYRLRLSIQADAARDKAGRVSIFLQEHLSAITQIQLLTRELAEARRFVRIVGVAQGAQHNWRVTAMQFSIVSMSIIALGIAIILSYGGYKVISGSLTAGGLVAFYSYLMRLFEPLGSAVEIVSRIQRAGASIRRVMAVMSYDSLIKDRPDASPISREGPLALELKNVCFNYQADRPVLTDVNLLVNEGERAALVGSNGSGKSTIGKLLTRLYIAQSGEVLVDGVEMSKIQLRSLRSKVVLMPQEPILFDATLRENILYGNLTASQDELERVARLAQIQGLIDRLPKGWDEPIGPRGCWLSGGERQRIALARAALQNPKVLILDEPTAALDIETERSFLETIDQFAQGRTVLVISHRLPTILWADRIIVIDQGRVVGQGTHEQLYKKSTTYRWLCKDAFESEINAAATRITTSQTPATKPNGYGGGLGDVNKPV